MEADRPSVTAQTVAAMRAAHWLAPGPHVFEDPYALALTSDEYRALHDRGELVDVFERMGLLPIQGQILGRARWAEEALERAVAAGARQYVLVGAGLDAFVLRRPDLLATLRVFELDHPATQRFKRERLAALGFDPAHPQVEFAAVDFERERIDAALARTRFSGRERAFFAWLGVTAYLELAEVLDTLRGIRACAAPGSEVLFDYPIDPERLAPEHRALAATARRSAEIGEPRRATHEPAELQRDVGALGYELVEDLSWQEHRDRYFAGRTDELGPFPQVRLAHWVVKG